MSFWEIAITLAVGFVVAAIVVVVRHEVEMYKLSRSTPRLPKKGKYADTMNAVRKAREREYNSQRQGKERLRDATPNTPNLHRSDGQALQWENIVTPEHRPEGEWVNWNFGSGWIKVKGTSNYAEEIGSFLLAIDDFNDETDTLRINLNRDPYNAYDPNAVEVYATFTGTTAAEFMLGFVEVDAAEWLADEFASDMPIAATIMRLWTNYENTSITICGLMPAKKERDQYLLA